MASESTYRVEIRSPRDFLFHVRPAAASLSLAVVSLVGFLLLAAILAIVLGLLMGGGVGASVGFALAFYVYWRHYWANMLTAAKYRKRAEIAVASTGLRVGDHNFALGDVAGFEVRAPASSLATARVIRQRENAVFVGDARAVFVAAAAHSLGGALDAGFDAGQAVGSAARDAALADHNRRSFVLTIVGSGDVDPVVLAGGLSIECADALVEDLDRALRRATAPTDQHGNDDFTHLPSVSAGFQGVGLMTRALGGSFGQLLTFGVFGLAFRPLLSLFTKTR